MHIAGVPEKITRAQFGALLRSLGLEPRGLRHLEFQRDCIRATVYALNERGEKYLDRHSGRIATHEVHIPVVDDEAGV